MGKVSGHNTQIIQGSKSHEDELQIGYQVALHTSKTQKKVSKQLWHVLEMWTSHRHTCPLLKDYWCKILCDIAGIIQIIILEADIPLSLNIKTVYFQTHLINAARTLIPRYWKKASPPSHMEWQYLVEETRKFEEITYILHNTSTIYWNIWEPWLSILKDIPTH